MKKKHLSIAPYFKGSLIVILAFLIGFFLPKYISSDSISRGGRVQLVGPIQKLGVLEKVLDKIEEDVGEDTHLVVEEWGKGKDKNQYMVSLDGTIASVENPLQEYGFIITVDDGQKSPLATSVINREIPEQYYALARENLDGEFDVKVYRLHD